MIRRVLLTALLLLAPALASAQTYVQRCSSGDAGTSSCSGFSGSAHDFATLTAGAFVVVTVRVPNTTTTVTGITGCGSGWARAFSRVSGSERNETWYAANLGAIACAPVPTWSAADPGARIAGLEFSGVATATPLDVISVNSGATTAAYSSGATATLAQATNLALGTCVETTYTGTFSALASGYTAREPTGYPTGGMRILMASKVTSSTSAETFTVTTDTAQNWACGVAVFKAPGGGGGTIQTGPVLFPLMGVGR